MIFIETSEQMDGRFNYIVEYLNNKKNKNFTGSTKLSFENGRLVAINEANKHDLPVTSIKDNQNIVEECLSMAKDTIFNGAIIFVFEAGNVIQYAYSKSYKGDTLKKYLGI